MIAELLRHPSGTAPLAERPDSHGYRLPDFLGTGWSPRCSADTNRASARMALILRWCVAGRIMSLDLWFPLTTSPGPRPC
jgi:hypothetical protein